MCISIRYSLNYRVHKIFLEKLPGFMKIRVKTLHEYLEQINYDPLFYWDRKNNRVEISLANPKMPKILTRTHYRPEYVPKYVGNYFDRPRYEKDLMEYLIFADIKTCQGTPPSTLRTKKWLISI